MDKLNYQEIKNDLINFVFKDIEDIDLFVNNFNPNICTCCIKELKQTDLEIEYLTTIKRWSFSKRIS